MSHLNPPIGPQQLPPRTDEFTFVNLTPHPNVTAEFIGRVLGPPGAPQFGPVVLTVPGGNEAATGKAPPDFRAMIMECEARVAGQTFRYFFDSCPPNTCICHVTFGVREADDPNGIPTLIPFGHVILENGVQVTF